MKIRQASSDQAQLEVLKVQLSEQAVNLSSTHNEALEQKRKAEELAKKLEEAEKKAEVAEREVREVKEVVEKMSNELRMQKENRESAEESSRRLQKEKAELEEKLYHLVKEKEEAESRAKESEEKLGSAKAGRLEAESKFLQVEVAHASCGSHIANLLDSEEREKRELKEKEEGWLAEREKLVEGISEGFNTGVNQLKVFLQERYLSAGIDWEAVTMDDVLACDAGEEEERRSETEEMRNWAR